MVDLGLLYQLFCQKKRILFSWVIVGFLSTVGVQLFTPNLYRAEVSLRAPSESTLSYFGSTRFGVNPISPEEFHFLFKKNLGSRNTQYRSIKTYLSTQPGPAGNPLYMDTDYDGVSRSGDFERKTTTWTLGTVEGVRRLFSAPEKRVAISVHADTWDASVLVLRVETTDQVLAAGLVGSLVAIATEVTGQQALDRVHDQMRTRIDSLKALISIRKQAASRKRRDRLHLLAAIIDARSQSGEVSFAQQRHAIPVVVGSMPSAFNFQPVRRSPSHLRREDHIGVAFSKKSSADALPGLIHGRRGLGQEPFLSGLSGTVLGVEVRYDVDFQRNLDELSSELLLLSEDNSEHHIFRGLRHIQLELDWLLDFLDSRERGWFPSLPQESLEGASKISRKIQLNPAVGALLGLVVAAFVIFFQRLLNFGRLH